MKFTLSWLKDHLTTTATLAEITTCLTAIGLEVEDVTDYAQQLAPFTVAEIISTTQHPNADRLKVCTVNTGSENLQIVCGAPNARAGIKVALSRPGDYIPGLGKTLGQSVIRGIESQGMLCSADELGLANERAEGILELPADAPLGEKIAAVLGLNDALIDINLTPNRGDCAGVRGIARDLAAAGLGTLKPLAVPEIIGNFKPAYTIDLSAASAACPAFALRVIKGVKNAESPAWLQQKLKAIGIKPISALVDITNYLTLDIARPLHVFDAAKIHGTQLTVRMAQAGEKLEALNNKIYDLTPDCLVIADAAGVESIAGVMGGLATGCTASTTDVIIESALFTPEAVAKSGRALQIISDARYRFERGVDPASVMSGMAIATQLILDICGGAASEVMLTGSTTPKPIDILYFPARCAELTGVTLSTEQQVSMLEKLGCAVRGHGDHFHVTPPSWRYDLSMAEDLVEEVLRLTGYASIQATPLPAIHSISTQPPALNVAQRRVLTARRLCASRGLAETVTFSFMPQQLATHFAPKNQVLTLINPISSDLSQMRPSIIGNLLQAAAHNFAHGIKQVALFEVGPVFFGTKPEQQENVVTGLRVASNPKHWAGTPAPDMYSIKADLMALLAQFGLNPETVPLSTDAPSYYHPGRSAVVRLGATIIGTFGELHPLTARAAGFDDAKAFAFELFINRLPIAKKQGTAKPLLRLPPLQAVQRDFAFVVANDVAADSVLKCIKKTEKDFVTAAEVFDIYSGDKVPAGHKSLAVTVTLQPKTQAFTEADLEKISTSIIAAVTKATGAVLR